MNAFAGKMLALAMVIPLQLSAQTVIPIGVGGQSTGESAIAAGAGLTAVVAFEQIAGGGLKVASCVEAAGLCSPLIVTVDNRSPNRGQGMAMEIGDDNLPIISYFDDDAVLHVAKCVDATCAATPVLSDGFDTGTLVSGARTSIAIGIDGNPVIAYYDQGATALKALMCANPSCAFAVPLTIDDSGSDNVGTYNDVAIGSDGSPVFSYYDVSHDRLKVAWCASANCVTGGITRRTADDSASDEIGQYTSIAIGENGFPLISYYNATQGLLRLMACKDLSCDPALAEFRILDDPVGVDAQAGAYSNIVVPADGRPVISYLRFNSSRSALAVARCVDDDCDVAPQITRPDSSSVFTGVAGTMAIGSNGLPLISYFDLSNLQLKVMRCDSGNCDVMFAGGFEE